jgi:2-polyprenyl-3-methyl-5-hydroxy-6-metoxy-1,4-benzoquinol methylase
MPRFRSLRLRSGEHWRSSTNPAAPWLLPVIRLLFLRHSADSSGTPVSGPDSGRPAQLGPATCAIPPRAFTNSSRYLRVPSPEPFAANSVPQTTAAALEARARQSRGISSSAIYEMVNRALSERGALHGTIVDVGCGTGNLRRSLGDGFVRYLGIDAVRYPELPAEIDFLQSDLNAPPTPVPSGIADVVVSVETIEHLENPRAFVRELVRLAKPGGWVMLTTPNQLSLRSFLNLVFRHRFVAFRDENYPAHVTALLEIDLRRIAAECGLSEVSVGFTLESLVPATTWRYPRALARRFPLALSDNVLLIGRKPDT